MNTKWKVGCRELHVWKRGAWFFFTVKNADGLVVYRGKGASQKTAKMAAEKYASTVETPAPAPGPYDFGYALMALNQLLTALHPGPWSPGVNLSFFEGQGCTGHWFIGLHRFQASGIGGQPERIVIFKGRFETPRAAVKAALEFLLPKTHDVLVEQLCAIAAKL